MPPSICTIVDSPAASIRSRSVRSFGRICGMNGLPAEPRIHRHHQHDVDELEHVQDRLDGRVRIETHARADATTRVMLQRSDRIEVAMQVRGTCLDVRRTRGDMRDAKSSVRARPPPGRRPAGVRPAAGLERVAAYRDASRRRARETSVMIGEQPTGTCRELLLSALTAQDLACASFDGSASLAMALAYFSCLPPPR